MQGVILQGTFSFSLPTHIVLKILLWGVHRYYLFHLFKLIEFIFHSSSMHRCYGAEVYYWLCIDVIVPLCSFGVYHYPFSLHAQMLWCKGLITGSAQMFCVVSLHLVLSSWMVNKTLYQMCGRLYLPIILLSVGLLTLMYMASLMALATF